MASTTKVLSDSYVTVPYFTWSVLHGKWIEGSPSQCRTVVRALAEFSRPKPNPLSSTAFDFSQVVENAESVEWFNSTHYLGSKGAPKSISRLKASTLTQYSGDGSLELARARAKVSDYNFGESLGELLDTTRLISKRAGSIINFVRDVRSGRWRKMRQSVPKAIRSLPASRRLSDGYLELSFGWLPAITDMYNATEAYIKGTYEEGDVIRRRSGGNQRKLSRNSAGQVFEDTNFAPEASATFSGIVKSPVQAQLSRLGLANPLLTAWNLVPFSFLVDWFLPIAPIIGSISANLGLIAMQQSVTTRSRQTSFGTDTVKGVTYIVSQSTRGLRMPASGAFPLINLLGGINSVGKLATSLALVRSVMIGGRK